MNQKYRQITLRDMRRGISKGIWTFHKVITELDVHGTNQVIDVVELGFNALLSNTYIWMEPKYFEVPEHKLKEWGYVRYKFGWKLPYLPNLIDYLISLHGPDAVGSKIDLFHRKQKEEMEKNKDEVENVNNKNPEPERPDGSEQTNEDSSKPSQQSESAQEGKDSGDSGGGSGGSGHEEGSDESESGGQSVGLDSSDGMDNNPNQGNKGSCEISSAATDEMIADENGASEKPFHNCEDAPQGKEPLESPSSQTETSVSDEITSSKKLMTRALPDRDGDSPIRYIEDPNDENFNGDEIVDLEHNQIRSSKGWGGVFYNEDSSCNEYSNTNKGLVKSIAKEIDRLVKDTLNPVGKETPRLDKKRLVKELIQKSNRLQRVQKRELEPAYAVLAVDVSGSCSSFSYELVEAFRSVVSLNKDRVALLLHSNGLPEKWYTPWPVKTPQTRDWRNPFTVQDWIETCDGDIGLVLWVGDGDGYESACLLQSRNTRIVWLDNYCASYGVQVSKVLHNYYPNLQVKRGDLIQGVGRPVSVYQALKLVK